jgi:hypothetical protein
MEIGVYIPNLVKINIAPIALASTVIIITTCTMLSAASQLPDVLFIVFKVSACTPVAFAGYVSARDCDICPLTYPPMNNTAKVIITASIRGIKSEYPS